MSPLIRNILRIIIALVTLVIFTRVIAQRTPEHPWSAQFSDHQRPLVIAHADDSGTSPWPGDTHLFLENAANMGVDVLEMNIHMSADGEIVLMHDETVDDTTNGTGLIKEMKFVDLQKLDAAYDWTQDGGRTYPFRGQGVRIPSLSSVFERYPGYPMIIEIKQTAPPVGPRLCELIRSYSAESNAIVAAFSDSAVQEFRAACPEVATAAASGETRRYVILSMLFLVNPIAPPFQAFQVPLESGGITVVKTSFINTAHRQNIEIHPWTINDPLEMRRLIDLGVDGIMTDRPDLLMAILES